MSKVGKQSAAESEKRLAVGSENAVQSPLTGHYEHALDPKKRLTIPSGWRKDMGDPAFVYAMPDRKKRCVNILPKAQMDAFLAKINEMALFDPKLNDHLQTIGSVIEQLDLDIQGRIRISDKLLQFANLTTTVAMLGSFRMIKLWNPAALEPEKKDDAAALDAALAAMGM